jgi:tetratricopeptide (TPR) repeat protein
MAYSTRAACLVLAGALTWPAISEAALTPDEMARQHFESGVAYLQESDLDAALSAFQKAYDLSGRPKILLNIATVHERMGQPGLAADDLEKYLELEPETEERATVEARIKNLRKRAVEAPAEAVPAEPSPPSPAPVATAAPAATPAPAAATEPAPTAEPNRVPAIIAFSVAGAAAGGLLVTQILATNEKDDLKDTCSPTCSSDDTSSGRALAWTSVGLGALAVVGAGVGAALWFTAEPDQEQVAVVPRVYLGASPFGASAKATWSF